MHATAIAVPETQLSIGPMALHGGAELPEVTVAYATYGQLATDGGNAILVTHGYTSSHRMLAHGSGTAEGSWAPLIGPGKPLDTARYFVICSNALGSCYGTTGPSSLNPRTGKPYGHDFPTVHFEDIVEVQRRLLTRLGITHLRAVVGPSYGGFQALQWAVDHPQWMDAIGVIASAPYFPRTPYTDLDALDARLATDPAWRGDAYPVPGAMLETLTALRIDTLKTYGMDAVLTDQGLDAAERARRIAAMARAWAREFDPGSLRVLLKAGLLFDVRPRLQQIQADVLHVIASSDTLFPPQGDGGSALKEAGAGRRLRYVEMDTPYGHSATGPAHHLWSGALRELLEGRQQH